MITESTGAPISHDIQKILNFVDASLQSIAIYTPLYGFPPLAAARVAATPALTGPPAFAAAI